MDRPSIPDWDEFFLRHVYLAASKSKDPRTQIGAILVKDKTVISEGYNGFPRGVNDYPNRYADREMKYSLVVHAELNAILNCVRVGISTLNSIMYTDGVPCNECAKAVIQAGIKEVVIDSEIEDLEGKWVEARKISLLMFHEAGVNIRKIKRGKLGLGMMRNGVWTTV